MTRAWVAYAQTAELMKVADARIFGENGLLPGISTTTRTSVTLLSSSVAQKIKLLHPVVVGMDLTPP